MKKLYSIGETAKIMKISVQTLRNYSNFSFLKPAYINDETGYRYYSFDQFHIIDRIKYLRSFGLSLTEIQEIMVDGKKVDKIISFLELRDQAIQKQIDDLKILKEDINWYINYFKYLNQSNLNALPHVSNFSTRYILYTKCAENETIEDIEVRLASLKNHYLDLGLRFHRQFGYLLNYSSIIQKEWKPTHYFTYIVEPDAAALQKILASPDIFKLLPGGDYLCFSFRLRHMEELNVNLIEEYFKNLPIPPYVIANEHEDNLETYSYCPYELQFLLS